ncbi:MAG: signal peptidase I [Aquihabitans sp.]
MPSEDQDHLTTDDDGLERRARRHAVAADHLTDSDSRSATATGDFDVTDEEVAAARAARMKQRPNKSPLRNLVEWVAVIAGAVVLAVVVRTFLFQTFWIPSGSMAVTLETNDRVLVNKLSYQFGDPSRGDVVVFERPPGETGAIKDLIKRVVAKPGEHIAIHDGSVWINGSQVTESYTNGKPSDPMVECSGGANAGIETPEGLLIPEGHVFVMGDNRTNSHDSRCFGPIAEDSIVGRAFLILWPPSKAGGL